jgi:hypothetical protein
MAIGVAASLLVLASQAHADFVVNGGFTSGPGGLGGWMVNDSAAITASGGVVSITEDQSSTAPFPIQLSQTFTIPTGALTLQFSIVGLSTDPAPGSFIPPPFFSVDLLNPTSQDSLVTANPTTTDYYSRDLTPAPFFETFPAGVTVTPTGSGSASPGSPIIVSLTLPSALAGQSAELVFSLGQDGDNISTNASVSITNVIGTTSGGNGGGGGPVTTPEPSSFILLATGAMVVVGRVWRSRRRQR